MLNCKDIAYATQQDGTVVTQDWTRPYYEFAANAETVHTELTVKDKAYGKYQQPKDGTGMAESDELLAEAIADLEGRQKPEGFDAIRYLLFLASKGASLQFRPKASDILGKPVNVESAVGKFAKALLARGKAATMEEAVKMAKAMLE